jgi:hypothetical protein
MTSVEFIISNMQSPEWEYTPWAKRKLIIEHAKEMHQKEIKEAWYDGDLSRPGERAQAYYDNTFKR